MGSKADGAAFVLDPPFSCLVDYPLLREVHPFNEGIEAMPYDLFGTCYIGKDTRPIFPADRSEDSAERETNA